MSRSYGSNGPQATDVKEQAMKVVLFCGGFGTRLRDYSDSIPKPMVPLGYRPILWHIMKYYAYYGHREFILCLGWRADVIKQYFLNYNECLSNNFVLSNGGESIKLLSNDIQDWKITFVDTGTKSSIGERLLMARDYLEGDEMFLANYSDGLTDLPLPELIDFAQQQDAIGTFMAVRPNQSFHTVQIDDDGVVNDIAPISKSDVWIDGGYFALRNEIFDYLRWGDELVHECFDRLMDIRRLSAFKYRGFWGCMDTYKDKQRFDDMYSRGETPWEVWEERNRIPVAVPASLPADLQDRLHAGNGGAKPK